MPAGYKTAYGLEIAGKELILVRTSRRGVPQPVLTAPLDSPEAARVLQAVTQEVDLGSAALAVAVPATLTAVRRLRAPFASAHKAAKVLPALLDVELPFPVESAQCTFSTPRVVDGGTIAVAAAVRTNDLAALAEASRAAGYDPTQCDCEALALWSQLAAEAPPVRAGLPRALIWLGPDHVTLARGCGSDFMAAHVLRASPLSDDRAAFENLWAARAPQIFAAHLAETNATEMDGWWAGPGAEDDERISRLRRILPAAIRHETCRQPASFLARALARRAADGTGVNFRSGNWMHPALVRVQEKSLKAAYGGIIAAAIVILALNLGEQQLRKQRIAGLAQALTTAARAIAGEGVPYGQEAEKVEQAVPRRMEESRPFRQALDPEGLEGRLASILQAAADHRLEVSRLELSPAGILMEGSASDSYAIESLHEQLRGMGWDVQWQNSGPAPTGRQQFNLKGAARNEG